MTNRIESPYIISAGDENFKQRVLDNSNRGPVLVHFWVRNAGPCLKQLPILEELIAELDGKVLLANVDTAKETMVSRELEIASVPTLKLFRNGRIVQTLQGLQSREDVEQMLKPHLTRESDQVLTQAIDLFASGENAQAYKLIADAIQQDPDNPRLPLAMCKMLNYEGRYSESLKLIQSLPEDLQQYPELVQLRGLVALLSRLDLNQTPESLHQCLQDNPADTGALQQLILYQVRDQAYEQALENLVRMMDQDPQFDHDFPRQAMLNLFDVLGVDHALTARYRPSLRRYSD